MCDVKEHFATYVTLKLNVANKCFLSKVSYRDRNEQNKINFYRAVREHQWQNLLDITHIAECYEQFSSKLDTLFDVNFSIRTIHKKTTR